MRADQSAGHAVRVQAIPAGLRLFPAGLAVPPPKVASVALDVAADDALGIANKAQRCRGSSQVFKQPSRELHAGGPDTASPRHRGGRPGRRGRGRRALLPAAPAAPAEHSSSSSYEHRGARERAVPVAAVPSPDHARGLSDTRSRQRRRRQSGRRRRHAQSAG